MFEGQGAAARHAPATLRNRDVIVNVLRAILPETGSILEIASGTGEHILYFAQHFTALQWQPSDPDPAALMSIAAWSAQENCPNVAQPLQLDAAAKDWPTNHADAILCINMVHIAPWAATLGLLAGASRILQIGAPLYLYGPYIEQDVQTAPSNLDFDASLKSRNPDWGLRPVADIIAAAQSVSLQFEQRIAMPANNVSLIFRRSE